MPMTPDQVTAIDVPDDEKLRVIAAFDNDVQAFQAWQREALATKVEQLLSAKATANASALVAAEIAEGKEGMPSLFLDAAEPDATP